MLKFADIDKPTLHLIYDMWDTMIENVKDAIYPNLSLDKPALESVVFVDGVVEDEWWELINVIF